MNNKTTKIISSRDKANSVRKAIAKSHVITVQSEFGAPVHVGSKSGKFVKPKHHIHKSKIAAQFVKLHQQNRIQPCRSMLIDSDHEIKIEKLIELQSKISITIKEIYTSEIIEVDGFSAFIASRCRQ